MDEQSDIIFIFEELKKLILEQQTQMIDYLESAMTDNERIRHGGNILNCLLEEKSTIARIKIELLVDGRSIK